MKSFTGFFIVAYLIWLFESGNASAMVALMTNSGWSSPDPGEAAKDTVASQSTSGLNYGSNLISSYINNPSNISWSNLLGIF